ncbi:MAG: UbiA family prenyltransferase [Candidatus Aenigmatarchaeota archaeon]
MQVQGPEAQVKGKESVIALHPSAYLEILRPINGAMAALGVVIGAAVIGVTFPLPLEFFVAIAITFMVSGAGMVVNDYFDYNIDRINRPKRPLPSGRMSRKSAKLYAGALYLVSNLLAIFLLNTYLAALTFFNTLVTYFYAENLKKRPIGHMAVGWLAASTFLYGGLLLGFVSPIIMILVAVAFFSNLGREITKAIEDMRGDRKYHIRSIPITIGTTASRQITSIFIVIAIILSFIPYIMNVSGITELFGMYYLLVVILADFIFLYSIYIIKNVTRSQKMMKIAMFVVLLAFLAGLV